MEIKNINDKAVWEAFENKDAPYTFLQSWEWGGGGGGIIKKKKKKKYKMWGIK